MRTARRLAHPLALHHVHAAQRRLRPRQRARPGALRRRPGDRRVTRSCHEAGPRRHGHPVLARAARAAAATAALLADLAPRTVGGSRRRGPAGAPRQGGGVGGMVRAARSRRRRRPAGVGRRGRDRGPRAGTGRGRHAVPRPGGRRRPRPARRRARSATAATAVVLDPSLLDLRGRARRRFGRGRRGRLRGDDPRARCSRRTATAALPIVEVAIADAAPATDLTRAVAAVTVVADAPNAPIGAAVRRGRDRPQSGARADHHRRRPRRHDGGRARHHVRVRQGAPAVRRRHRLVPGGAAPAGRRAACSSRVRVSVAQYAAWAVDALPPAEALAAGAVGQGLLRPRRPHRVRDRHPGARRHRQHVGVPGPRATCAARCCRATCSAARATTWRACSRTHGTRRAADGLR